MIAYLNGQLQHKSALLKKDNFLVVVAGGVGYKVFVFDRLLEKYKVGDNLELHIYTQVAETALDLYGFPTRQELDFFEIVISLQGIGPKSAMDILQKAKIEDLKQATQTGNYELLSKISGLGPKTAQKVVLGLKEKFGSLSGDGVYSHDGFGEALEALVGLGYQPYQAREALANCKATDTSEKVKEALKILGRK
ncbi:MAG: Holliday junction branch migration protein RuvA [bacterium]